MKWPRLAARVLAYVIASAVVAVVVLVVAIQIQQRILRYRAERLYTDIRSLQVRRSTYADAVKVFARWSRGGRYDIPCSKEYCNFSIAVTTFGDPENLLRYCGSEWCRNLYWIARSRLAGANASVFVRGGIVWKADFQLYTDVGYWLEGRVVAVPRLEPHNLLFNRLHPDYEIGWPGACLICVMIWVNYSPYADPAEIDRVARPNFGCITGWRQCRDKADIMPAAMAEAAADATAGAKARATVEATFLGDEFHLACTRDAVAITSRDAENGGIFEIIRNDPDRQFRRLLVRLLARLKNAQFLGIGSRLAIEVGDPIAIPPVNDVSNIHEGSHVIILFTRESYPRVHVAVYEDICGLLPLTEQNLALVESGIRLDRRVHLFPDPDSEPQPARFSDPPKPSLLPPAMRR